ncbi:MAG TPA: recombinase family protein, partial [Anseongella sp.]
RGQHEPIITESLCYEVQDVLNGKKRFKEKTRTKIVSLDMLPLHGFLRCPKCTRMLSGSASKGCGGYYYYYHCSASCRVRFRAVDVNGLFEKEIGHFTVREGLEYIYRDWVLQKFRSDYNGGMNSQRAILDKIQELTEKISRARDMALDGDFDATDFKAVKQDCENQIAALEAKLPDVIQATRNVQDNLEKAFAKMGKVYDAYMERDMKTKRRIISSVYPENLLFDGFQHRTNRTNDIAFNTVLITK